ncbi:MAG TPA: hypothetical protein VEU11_05955 [Terriglobales bacterium]|nr:hypothetical protein [Terriglobales bacterium]
MLETIPPLPENRTAACRELLRAALALADDFLRQAEPEPRVLAERKKR